MAELSVAIVDDNPIILNTLDEILKNEDGLSVIGKAENGEEAINMIKDKNAGCGAFGPDYAKDRRNIRRRAGEKRTSCDQESRIYYSQRGGRRTDGGGSVSGGSELLPDETV